MPGIFFPDEPAFLEEVKTFVAAVAVVKGLKNARIGQVGVRPSSFETVGYDEAALADKFGQNVIYSELADVVSVAEGFADTDSRVKDAVTRLRSDMAEVTISDRSVLNAARLEVALADFWSRGRLSAMAVQCWPAIQAQMGISLCATQGRLDGAGNAHRLRDGRAGGARHAHQLPVGDGGNGAAFHRLDDPAPRGPQQAPGVALRQRPCMPREGPGPDCAAFTAGHDRRLPVVERDANAGLAQFQVRPGRVTFCRLAEYDNDWKMLIATGDIVPSDETLAGTWAWVRVKDHARLYRTLVEEGFVHHASMIHGDQSAALAMACMFLGILPVVVGKGAGA